MFTVQEVIVLQTNRINEIVSKFTILKLETNSHVIFQNILHYAQKKTISEFGRF